MDKKLSNRERNRRMFMNMHNSFGNKMQGENLIWWNSLSLKAQYSVLFKWLFYKKYYKEKGKNIKPKIFLKVYKKSYNPTLSNYRNTKISMIIKNSKNNK